MVKAADSVVSGIAASKGEAELFSWGVNKSWAEGGDDPCEDVWVHDSDEEQPHWHYVTSGLSDPAKVEAKDSGRSGLGYELSFRLKRTPGDADAPEWPRQRLQEMGSGILKTNMKLGVGHYLRRRSVITSGDPPTTLLGYYLIADPRLQPVISDSGSIEFLQMIGITEEELFACESGEPDEMEADLLKNSPLGITDLERATQDEDEVDLLKLNALQSLLGRNCLDGLSESITNLEFSTFCDPNEEPEDFEHTVAAGSLFKISRRTDASIKRIFALHWAAGAYVNRISAKLTQAPDGQWTTVLAFEYAPD